jgi:8-oxo-dGTP pyrophosphatase MutT (NUDIX family)
MNPTAEEIAARLGASQRSARSDGYAASKAASGSLKCAAVLVPLFQQNNEWHILFTRRTDRVESHKGQVSFPGGACDNGETSPEQTALREAEEEIGLVPRDVHLLGRLRPMETITSFLVVPVVGIIPWPYVFRPEQNEVARIFTMPLTWLAEPSNRWEFNVFGRKHNIIFFHPYDGELLWGATARMTVDFLEILGINAIQK